MTRTLILATHDDTLLLDALFVNWMYPWISYYSTKRSRVSCCTWEPLHIKCLTYWQVYREDKMQQLYRIFIYINEMEWDALARSKYHKWQFTTNLRFKLLTFWQNTFEQNIVMLSYVASSTFFVCQSFAFFRGTKSAE